nr:zinc finger protein 391 [Drosophila kikkawai]
MSFLTKIEFTHIKGLKASQTPWQLPLSGARFDVIRICIVVVAFLKRSDANGRNPVNRLPSDQVDMIRLQTTPPSNSPGGYHNFRCGEILYSSPASYDVCCSLCGQRLALDSFPNHFRTQHLSGNEPESDPIAQEDRKSLENEEELVKEEPKPEAEEHVEKEEATTAMENTLVETQEDLLDMNLDWTSGQLETKVEHEEDEDDKDDDDDDSEQASQVDDTKDMLFQCDHCDRAYNSKRSLQSHRRLKHTDVVVGASKEKASTERKAKKRKGPPKVYKCHEKECNQTFRTERDLHGHRWKHTGIFCDICGKPFTQSGNMMRHRQRHSGIKPHKCPECDATFYTQKELSSHSICHTGRMPCICEVCGRPCRDRGVLTAHMRRHTGERPAKCEVCGKAFYSFHDLNVHAVSHTSLRPFVCDVCGSTFQRKKALRVHKLLHSEQRKYACKLCGKTFAQSGGLNAHMRSHDPSRVKGPVKPLPQSVTIEVIEGRTAPTTTITMAIDLNVEEEEQHQQQQQQQQLSASGGDGGGSWPLTPG